MKKKDRSGFRVCKLSLLVALVTAIAACSSPTSTASATTISGNAIVKSLTMNNVTPTNTTSYSRSVARDIVVTSSANLSDATSAMTNAFYMAGNLPEQIVTLLQNYVADSPLAIGTTNSLSAKSAVSGGDGLTLDFGASQIKIVQTSTDVFIYWSTTATQGGTSGLTQVKLDLTNFSNASDPTSYQKATGWVRQSSSGVVIHEVKAINNLATGEFDSYQAPCTSFYGGIIVGSGKSGGGVYKYGVMWGPSAPTYTTMVESYGNGAGVIIETGGVGQTLYTATYGTSSGLAAALAACPVPAVPDTTPNSLANATTSVNAITAANAGYTATFVGSSGSGYTATSGGTFSSELGDPTTWF